VSALSSFEMAFGLLRMRALAANVSVDEPSS
jgi:hypothetical protein